MDNFFDCFDTKEVSDIGLLSWMSFQIRNFSFVITTAQIYSAKPELRFWRGSNPARAELEVCDNENL